LEVVVPAIDMQRTGSQLFNIPRFALISYPSSQTGV